MAAPATIDEFLDLVRKSGVTEDKRLDAHLQKLRSTGLAPSEPSKLAGVLVRDGLLTHFQAEHLMQGKWRRFTIGKYKVLERLGTGGMGQVFLCEHKLMRRRVAVKVLPTAKAKDDSARERFYREARAVAALDHPNIVHAYDIDQDEDLHFLVMEYVDGASLQDIVKKSGPMEVSRACHYIRQSALGLEHAHQAGIVHRDVKPGNILVDRGGVVKLLDMGLARFFNDEEDILTKKYDENVLGTADYLAPEQALDSHDVTIRADIYSLGATFYYMLTGKTPFGEGTVAQKLIWHQTRKPKAVTEQRKDLPAGLDAVLNKMMAKDPAERYGAPGEVAEALAAYITGPVAPPSETEMPRLSPAATGAAHADTAGATSVTRTPTSPMPVKSGPALSRPMTPGPAAAPAQRRGPATPAPSPYGPGQNAAAVAAPPGPKSAPPMPVMPTPPMPAQVRPQPQSAPQAEDDSVPWKDIAAALDTVGPVGQNDTAPSTVGMSSRALLKAEARAKQREKKRLWTVVLFLSVALAAAVGFIVIKYVAPRFGTTGPVGRQPLVVSKKGGKAFATVRQALSNAESGDIIELHDPVHEETLVVGKSGAYAAGVTLQAAPGVEVVWLPSSKDVNQPLLTFDNAAAFKLKGKGITLDGTLDVKRRVNNLVFITSLVSGLMIEDLTLRGFEATAVKIMNAQGEEGRPARLNALNIVGDLKTNALAGIYFDASDKHRYAVNDWIEVSGASVSGAPAIKSKNDKVNGKNVALGK